ncbi:DUF3017 domain-containing protein [Streptomyces sp. SYSU K217416]
MAAEAHQEDDAATRPETPAPAPEPGPDTGPGREPRAAGEDVAGPAGAAEDAGPVVPGAVSAPGADGVAGRVSRRFPSVTRDTARPEGGGRAAPGDAPAPARQWPLLAVLGATAAGLLVTALGHARIGCLVIGLALIGGAVLRRVLPSVGMLAVRSRFTDMVTYGLLGVAITLLALVAQPKPWLELPFLEEAVRFTIR